MFTVSTIVQSNTIMQNSECVMYSSATRFDQHFGEHFSLLFRETLQQIVFVLILFEVRICTTFYNPRSMQTIV